MIQLDQRQLGKSGIVVPALGVGVWSWGDKNTWGYGNSYTRADVTQAYRACLHCVDGQPFPNNFCHLNPRLFSIRKFHNR